MPAQVALSPRRKTVDSGDPGGAVVAGFGQGGRATGRARWKMRVLDGRWWCVHEQRSSRAGGVLAGTRVVESRTGCGFYCEHPREETGLLPVVGVPCRRWCRGRVGGRYGRRLFHGRRGRKVAYDSRCHRMRASVVVAAVVDLVTGYSQAVYAIIQRAWGASRAFAVGRGGEAVLAGEAQRLPAFSTKPVLSFSV